MKTNQPLVIVLLGPTASGKTDLAIEIAKHYKVHPDLYDDDNDYAKDCWIATGKDSLFKNQD